MEKGFVFLDEAIHGIRWDAKYATWDNFTGKPVNGYEANRIVASIELAEALQQAKEHAALLGYGLLIWDAYRPQRAVDCFVCTAGKQSDKEKTLSPSCTGRNAGNGICCNAVKPQPRKCC